VGRENALLVLLMVIQGTRIDGMQEKKLLVPE
jgi:hypothetical protein